MLGTSVDIPVVEETGFSGVVVTAVSAGTGVVVPELQAARKMRAVKITIVNIPYTIFHSFTCISISRT